MPLIMVVICKQFSISLSPKRREMKVFSAASAYNLSLFITTVQRRHRHSYLTVFQQLHNDKCAHSLEEHYQKKAKKYWDSFYKRHQNKFFKDRHYLEKDWGNYFSDDSRCQTVGCGAGNTIFPLVAAYPKLYVHACDISPHAIKLVKTHSEFREDRVNAFLCNGVHDDLSEKINRSSVDVVTLIFMLSAVSPKKMPLILQNIKTILKPDGVVLVRDYAVGDFAQVKLQDRNQMIGDGFYVRGDGTCSFYFSEDFLSNLFLESGFNTVDINTYFRQIQNCSRNITMDRRWIRAIFNKCDSSINNCTPIQDAIRWFGVS